jgi:hypothetical protein
MCMCADKNLVKCTYNLNHAKDISEIGFVL